MYCWCLLRREPSKRRAGLDLGGRRALMQDRVDRGEPVGLLGYLDQEPIAWCSVSPRDTYLPMGGPDEAGDKNVWSIVCFYIQRRHRRKGIARHLLAAAVEQAKANGADIVEAYAVDPDSPSYRFGGFRHLFLQAGFHEVGMAGTRRHVMRLHV